MSEPNLPTPGSYPEVTVGALILDRDDRIFLFQSHKWKDAWAIPGGHIEAGETALAAVHREVHEETGLTLVSAEFLCYQECVYDPAFWKERHFVFLDFLCRTNGGEVTLNDEAEDWKWYEPHELATLNIEPFTRKVLEAYFERKGL